MIRAFYFLIMISLNVYVVNRKDVFSTILEYFGRMKAKIIANN
uniref:Genome sequencing data, contig C283 n=1 Tax=Bartonella schoenbuchensis (strain DSM 13525 / NCTC 13165 / R1) TaxID=687861 RepID=E6YYA5_BARSR